MNVVREVEFLSLSRCNSVDHMIVNGAFHNIKSIKGSDCLAYEFEAIMNSFGVGTHMF